MPGCGATSQLFSRRIIVKIRKNGRFPPTSINPSETDCSHLRVGISNKIKCQKRPSRTPTRLPRACQTARPHPSPPRMQRSGSDEPRPLFTRNPHQNRSAARRPFSGMPGNHWTSPQEGGTPCKEPRLPLSTDGTADSDRFYRTARSAAPLRMTTMTVQRGWPNVSRYPFKSSTTNSRIP